MLDKVFLWRFAINAAARPRRACQAASELSAAQDFISTAEGRREWGAHLSRLASLQSQQINYIVHLIQIDFLTPITMSSSPVRRVSLTQAP